MKTFYYNINENRSLYQFYRQLELLITDVEKSFERVVLICIGSDRATGDSLGPMIGYKLSRYERPNLIIYGTLEEPVHAKNLEETLLEIDHTYTNSAVIAIDASLGQSDHVGYVTLAKGALSPGIGVNKNLPQVGDLHITGIVNTSGFANQIMLQTTRLSTVMALADFISMGILYATNRLQRSSSFERSKQRDLINVF